ncbi:MAG: SURF1 family protein [Rhodospirillales bacterium]|nr:SURF1 family protein [Rhodospirillales bacterium]MCB9973838.1 SURF1 family protein [Rhodospirillales bacterium]MCB9980504.1 SURF1 family protein [Rhodospirillales bacterium]
MKKIVGYVLFTAGFITLLALGSWQIQRAGWKAELLQQIETETRKDPAAYALSAADFEEIGAGRTFIRRGYIQGHYLSPKVLLWPKFRENAYGFNMLSPFETDSGDLIMVHHGWVLADPAMKIPLDRIPLPDTSTTVLLQGTVRLPSHNLFTPNNDPAKNRWYRFDSKEIAAYISAPEILPSVLYLAPYEDIPLPHNRHLSYALFWFSLAALWVIILGGRRLKSKYLLK